MKRIIAFVSLIAFAVGFLGAVAIALIQKLRYAVAALAGAGVAFWFLR